MHMEGDYNKISWPDGSLYLRRLSAPFCSTTGLPECDNMLKHIFEDLSLTRLQKAPLVKLRKGLLKPILPEEEPFQLVHIDHLGPFVVSQGFQHKSWWSLTPVPAMLNCFHAIVLQLKKQSTILRNSRYALRFGFPSCIIPDQGTTFIAELFESWRKTHAIQHTLISTRHPRANGLVERINRVIVPQMSILMRNEDNWMVSSPAQNSMNH